MWFKGIAGKGAQRRIAIIQSFGRVLSNGYLVDHSDEAVSERVQPHIEAILGPGFAVRGDPAIQRSASRIL